MPQIIPFVALSVMLMCPLAQAQSCAMSGKEAWNPALRNVIADCPEKFDSPDLRTVLQVTSNGVLSLRAHSADEKAIWDGPRLEPPAMISWSPQSNAFFINDGDGSGMSSSFRLFRVTDDQVAEDTSIEKAAVSLYRRRARCRSSAADPNVWGYGWTNHGSDIVLLIQPTVNEPCGKPENLISVVVHASDGNILQTLSKVQTKARFGSLLPPVMFGK